MPNRLPNLALIALQLGGPLFGLSQRLPNNLIWKSIRVKVDWVGPKSKIEPKGSPQRYSWKSDSGIHVELLPTTTGNAEGLVLRVEGMEIQLQSIPSLKSGWPSRFSVPFFPCGYNSISEVSIPSARFTKISNWRVCLVEWPTNAMGYPQTNQLLIFESVGASTFSAAAFEGENVTIHPSSDAGLVFHTVGVARPGLDYESWEQEIHVNLEANQHVFRASPLRTKAIH